MCVGVCMGVCVGVYVFSNLLVGVLFPVLELVLPFLGGSELILDTLVGGPVPGRLGFSPLAVGNGVI